MSLLNTYKVTVLVAPRFHDPARERGLPSRGGGHLMPAFERVHNVVSYTASTAADYVEGDLEEKDKVVRVELKVDNVHLADDARSTP